MRVSGSRKAEGGEDVNVPGLALAWEVVWKRFEHWPSWEQRPFAAILAKLPKDRFSVEMGVLLLHELPYARHDLERMLNMAVGPVQTPGAQ